MTENYDKIIINKISNKLKKLDKNIRVTIYDTSITITKIFKDEQFFSTSREIETLLRLEYTFGVTMVSEDILNSINEDIEDCYGD